MITEKFIKNDIHYIKEVFDSGSINIYADPDFQTPSLIEPTPLPILPPLSSTGQKLDFIIDELKLKKRYKE